MEGRVVVLSRVHQRRAHQRHVRGEVRLARLPAGSARGGRPGGALSELQDRGEARRQPRQHDHRDRHRRSHLPADAHQRVADRPLGRPRGPGRGPESQGPGTGHPRPTTIGPPMTVPRMIRRRPLAALVTVAALGLVLAGCFNPFSPRMAPVLGVSKPAPVPNNPTNLLRLFEWCYNNQAAAEYREIFSDDYRFYLSPTDSSGADWRGRPWTREDELISTTQLFVGGSATEPPASSIHLSLDRNFYPSPDPEFRTWPDGTHRDFDGIWHQNIRTTVTLRITTEDGGSTEIQGHANFYVVRGDSAAIPQELYNKGFRPDENRWYIRRWDDETAQEGGLAMAAALARTVPAARASRPANAFPYQVPSWGSIKAYYRNLPPYQAASAR